MTINQQNQINDRAASKYSSLLHLLQTLQAPVFIQLDESQQLEAIELAKALISNPECMEGDRIRLQGFLAALKCSTNVPQVVKEAIGNG